MRAGARHRESWKLSERAEEEAAMSGRGHPRHPHLVIDHIVNDDDNEEKREEDYHKGM